MLRPKKKNNDTDQIAKILFPLGLKIRKDVYRLYLSPSSPLTLARVKPLKHAGCQVESGVEARKGCQLTFIALTVPNLKNL
jgi:hypothetical protein